MASSFVKSRHNTFQKFSF